MSRRETTTFGKSLDAAQREDSQREHPRSPLKRTQTLLTDGRDLGIGSAVMTRSRAQPDCDGRGRGPRTSQSIFRLDAQRYPRHRCQAGSAGPFAWVTLMPLRTTSEISANPSPSRSNSSGGTRKQP